MDDLTKKMIAKASNALKNAYAPYSHFLVASCILSEDDQLFTGVNVENSSYGLTLCAESSAIAQMVTAGGKKIKRIVILSGNNELCSPCGACRQRIHEFATDDTLIYLCTRDSILKTFSLNDLLPLAFNLTGHEHE